MEQCIFMSLPLAPNWVISDQWRMDYKCGRACVDYSTDYDTYKLSCFHYRLTRRFSKTQTVSTLETTQSIDRTLKNVPKQERYVTAGYQWAPTWKNKTNQLRLGFFKVQWVKYICSLSREYFSSVALVRVKSRHFSSCYNFLIPQSPFYLTHYR